jgi:hypothetical protein
MYSIGARQVSTIAITDGSRFRTLSLVDQNRQLAVVGNELIWFGFDIVETRQTAAEQSIRVDLDCTTFLRPN